MSVLIRLSNEINYLFSFYNVKLNEVFVGNLYHETKRAALASLLM